MLNKRNFLFTLFILLTVLKISGQPPHTFTQYTSENGLSQKTIRSILQDHKGLMWFATWNGLYKFDGYTFKNYKAHPGDNIELSNNRLDYIKEDRYGYIWMQTYDHQIYRFNPKTGQFQAVPYEKYSSQDIYVLSTGDIWFTTLQGELVHVSTHPDTHELTVVNFFKTNQIPVPEKVNKIYQDKQQNQWILTENGLYRVNMTTGKAIVQSYFVNQPTGKQSFYDASEHGDGIYFASTKGRFLLFHNGKFSSSELPTGSNIKFVRSLSQKELFIGTENDGFFIYDIPAGTHQHYTKENHKKLKSNCVRDVYISAQNEIWMMFELPGITRFNPHNKQTDHFILQDKYGKDMTEGRMEINVYEDINGVTWIHPAGGGVGWYDQKNNRLVSFYNPSLQTGWTQENRVTSLFSDKQGNLWFCSLANGLEKVTFNTNCFNLLTPYPKDIEHTANNIRAVYQDRDGYIWVGSKDKIIRIYNKNLQYIGNLTAQGNITPNSADELGMAYAFTQDHKGTVWIGTKGKGLIAARRHAPLKFRLEHYTTDAKNPYSLSGNEIYSLYEDNRKRLWIATWGQGINYLDPQTDASTPRFINYRNKLKNYPIDLCNRTRFITGDRQGNLWIGSATGLLMCSNPDHAPEQIKFNHFTRIPGDGQSLSNNDVHNIFFNQKDEMYIATFGGGFNKLLSLDNGKARFQSYTSQDGLPTDILLSIEEDDKGMLWMATEEELCRFDPAKEKFTTYQAKSFPQHINFSEGAALHTRENKLIFSTMKGMLYFSPDSVGGSSYVPPILFTHFQAAEDIPGPEREKMRINNIDDMQSIRLSHKQNGFNIQFAALDMRYPNSILYAYQLEGFEKNWNYIGNQHTATYTNLPKGTYTLKVKSTNSDGVWVENTRTIDFTILPSFWETPWAYLLYVLLIALVILTATYILFTFFRLKHKVTVEQQISDIKLRFFTNISHELRTPLTLIAGPIEQILQNGHLKEEEKEQLTLVERNTNRMLRLVNQILDFRKIQNNKMKMRVQQIDLIPFVRHIMESFNYLADEHQIDFKMESPLSSLNVWADVDKLEKILFNLLSNAFKYTPQGKLIKVVITDSDKDIAISVEDQGIGIPENKQSSLFTRFESLVDKNLFNQSSTGIGLSLVKELIEIHHGSISLQSKAGEGSRFTVKLLKGRKHFDETTEFILSDEVVTDINQVFPSSQLTSLTGNEEEDINKERESILIVEDNQELRFFLKTIFVQYFNVIEAENGKVGLEKSKTYQPDIIVSDVMMPEMDGIELVHALREEMTTSHIPIVLLTAKSTIESKIEGMQQGADDYITKPFSAAYLKARIINLLEQRKKLQALYCASLLPNASEQNDSETEKEPVPVLSPNDQRFMDKIMETIEKNLDNGELMVEDIASEVNMSRSVFFKKLKTLTGLSPIEFLKEVRMKRAVQLIETEEYSMAQIAYMVGINDSHYFSKCFKQQYGITPTEYKKKKR